MEPISQILSFLYCRANIFLIWLFFYASLSSEPLRDHLVFSALVAHHTPHRDPHERKSNGQIHFPPLLVGVIFLSSLFFFPAWKLDACG